MNRGEGQPEVSDEARGKLIEELEDAVGKEAVEKADVDVDRAVSQGPSGVGTALADSKLLIILLGATALTVGVIVSLVTGSWWFVAIAMGVHALLTAVVVVVSMNMFSQVEKPDPNVVTKLQEEGIEDPEPVMNDLVEQVAGEDEGSREQRAVAGDAGETTPPEEDAADAAASQQAASTPSSEPTRKVGD